MAAGTKLIVDETYDLKGLDMITPDMLMVQGESPNLANCRMYAKEEGESRVAIRSRKGSTIFTTPPDETSSVNQSGTTVDFADVTATRMVATSFTAVGSGRLSKIILTLKSEASNSGVIVQICSDSSSLPGGVLATSSISASSITSTNSEHAVRFIESPLLNNGDVYWIVIKAGRSNTTGTVKVSLLSFGTSLYSTDNGSTYSTQDNIIEHQVFLASSFPVIGYTEFSPSNGSTKIVFAAGTKLYAVETDGTTTEIYDAISSSAAYVRFETIDDKLFFVDGYSQPMQWDGTSVTAVDGTNFNATHIRVHENRLFFVYSTDKTNVRYSSLYNFTEYPSVNFFYIPSPKTSDHISGWRVFQDNLVVFTKETKHIIAGNSISDFTRRQSIGTKGAVSDEAIAVDRNNIYFMADDKMIYKYNGISDVIISDKVEPILKSIADTSKVRFNIHDNQLMVYFCSINSSFPDKVLVLELGDEFNKKDQWFLDTNKHVMGGIEWKMYDNRLIEFSSYFASTYNAWVGTNDVGRPIDFKYWTAYKNYGSGSAKHRVKRFRPYVRTTGSRYVLSVGKDVNFENNPDMLQYPVNPGGTVWGSFSWGDGSKWGASKKIVNDQTPMTGRANHTQYRFECSELDAEIELYGYCSIIKTGRIR